MEARLGLSTTSLSEEVTKDLKIEGELISSLTELPAELNAEPADIEGCDAGPDADSDVELDVEH